MLRVPNGKTVVMYDGKEAWVDGYIYNTQGTRAVIVYMDSGELDVVHPKDLLAVDSIT